MSDQNQVLSMRVKAVEDALKQVVQVHQQNNQVIRHAFMTNDNHLVVLQRIIGDITEGVLVKDGERPDFAHYYHQLNQAIQLDLVLKWVGKITSPAPAPEPEEAVAPAVETVEEFGGDYAGSP